MAPGKMITHSGPNFFYVMATRRGRGAPWRTPDPAQRDELVRRFRTMIVRVYAVALSGFRDDEIIVLPLRGQSAAGEATVRSQVKRPGTAPTLVEYDMERTLEGWKVYDVRIEGISLMASYRSAFADEIRNRGVDGLIRTLASRQ
jgi:phospholipid transport system substrate-binding protein